MSDHESKAGVRRSRREFLRMGTGAAGAVSLGAILAACGAPSAQMPIQRPAAEEENDDYGKNAMHATRAVKSYMIIARYNLAKEKKVNAGGEHEVARNKALALFPYEEATQNLTQVEGTQTIHTFHSPFFDRLPDNFFSLPEEQQTSLANSVIAELGGENLGIGWMAVIDASAYDSFINKMGGKDGALWRIFDIDVIPLNDDRTTNDIYLLMTPRSWS